MRALLKKLRDALRPIYGNGETEAIIRIIFHYLKGWNTVDLLVHEQDPASGFLQEEVNKILGRLLKHEPIQYITGEARFHGLQLKVTPDVLIPRPETAELVDIIVDNADNKEDLQVLDVCTGSGCIAVALARSLKFPSITAVDISSAALEVARENSTALKAKVKYVEADIFKWTPANTFDMIVSNPPYIDESEKNGMDDNVLKYEPAQALFVPDSNPLIFYKRIASIAKDALNPGGKLYFEINPRHADSLSSYLSGMDFSDVEIIKDSFDKERFITASKKSDSKWH
ncbi:MAG: peptide chain release factor N(5)-glutamine methyltransferase [Bacteroides sp.]|nr:peptide chain release factor N(5)-glutamine methyltransferase [Bacteroides sp.]